ncbi:calcium-binding and coiled-coil domain-containing protein 2 isoform X2 [Hyperolius riggenbachi]|uniref:calcium-binding and coiled-coil domain-containing protein 2 isoform X2 n=1 Tax=Hyperolius riggenbachi TaxID=752182 RepID=UPI0035A2A92F
MISCMHRQKRSLWNFKMAEGSLKTDDGEDYLPYSMELINKDTFSQAIFPDVKHFYPPNSDIICTFHKRIPFDTGNRDWIGIYKVGWQAPKEFYTRVAVSRNEDHVIFKAYCLPKEDKKGNGEYYQFCYVDENSDVRGVSIPFQIRHEDSEEASDIFLVTREEEVEMLQQDNIRLKDEKEIQAENIQALEAELRIAKEKNQTQQEELMNCKKENEMLQRSNQESEQTRTKMQDSLLEVEQMRKQLETYEAENKHLQSQIMVQQQAEKKLSGELNKCKEENESLLAKLKAQTTALENTAKLKEELQRSFAEKKLTMEDLENKFNENRINLEVANDNISTLKQQLALQQMENKTKDEEVKKLQFMVKSLQDEVTELREVHLRQKENAKSTEGTLQVSLNIQNSKLSEAKNQIVQLQADLRSSQEKNTILQQKTAMLQFLEDDNWRKKEELSSLRSSIELREEEIQDLQENYVRKESEIEELKRELCQARQLQAFTGPPSIQSPGLVFGNPYDGAHSSIPVAEEARGSSETRANEERLTEDAHKCPMCVLEFDNLQTLEDHVQCHLD